MDDPLSLTPVGDTIQEDVGDSTESKSDPKDDSIILTQPTMDPPITPLVPSTEPLNVETLAQDVQDKDDKNPLDAPASQFSIFLNYCIFSLSFRQC